MTDSSAIDKSTDGQSSRRARVVILGEFSAGKSTLINLFTGAQSLRTQITATQMPAVWMSYGSDDPYRVDLEGNEHPVDPSNPDSISVDDTAYVRTFMKTPALEFCDFIDTPGNSDPNIASIAWERVAQIADVAVWCSSCTQAWRQSELAAWRDVPEAVRARSILLLTRADKLNTDDDRAKVLKRVKHEAGSLFTHIHMASLLDFDNVVPVLRDLHALCNTVEGAAIHDVDLAVNAAGGIAGATAAATATPLSPPVSTDGNDDTAASHNPETSADDEEMTDEMLINSLDLSSDEVSLDDFGLSSEDDADMDEVLAALTTPVAFGKPKKADQPAVAVATEPTPPPVAEPATSEGYASNLWRKMSDAIPMDDPDAYNVAFDMFLEKVDTEIAMLQRQAAMKAVG